MEDEDIILANGLDGDTGDYLLPPMSPSTIASVAMGAKVDPILEADLKWKKRSTEKHLGTVAGVDVKDLSAAGWAAVFPANSDPAIREALKPLLDHRKAQAAAKNEILYRECSGPEFGYLPGQNKTAFLKKNGAPGSGDVKPEQLPYYLLLVGSPTEIPFNVQYQLDVQYGVGRIHFDTLEEYARYAESVVAAETGKLARRARGAAYFGVSNPGDKATELSSKTLTAPLAEYCRTDQPDWTVTSDIGDAATRARLNALMGGTADAAPDFLFAACHGMGYSKDSERQRRYTGALTCQDWPGTSYTGPVRDFFFAGEDLASDARIAGMIAMFFACYGAGSPQFDEFYQKNGMNSERRQIAPEPFLAELPKRMLAHPKGGALAVIGHVDRAWDYSFRAGKTIVQLGTFESVIKEILEGFPVGAALERFSRRYSELASDTTTELNEVNDGKRPDEKLLSSLWCASNDARNYVVVGDPAVRLA